MKRLFFLFFIASISNIQASFNINTDVLNLNNLEQVAEYKLINEDGEIIIPKYLSCSQMLQNKDYIRIDGLFDAQDRFIFPKYFHDMTLLPNDDEKVQQSLMLIVELLTYKFEQIKDTQKYLEEFEPDNEYLWVVTVNLDYMLSLLNKLSDVARQFGYEQIYRTIQQHFFS